MAEQIGTLDSADGAWDDDGYHLTLSTDEGEGHLRVTDVEAARSLLNAVKDLEAWVREHDYHRAAYDRATPQERAEVLGRGFEEGDSGYEPDDPKSPGYHDRYAAFYDDRDKGEVGP